MGWSRLADVERIEIQRRLVLGESSVTIGLALGRSHDCVDRVRRECGGGVPRPRVVSGRCLSLAEREEISRGLTAKESFAAIGRRLGRPTSTISREVARNGGRQRYRAWVAHERAGDRARRPKRAKLATCARLR